MIRIDKVTKCYDRVKSLDGIDTVIESGSIFGLIGSNGSGKSTLLRVMSGIFRPDSGSVEYDGKPVFENVPLKNEIVYLSDEQYFLPAATLDDMARLYAAAYAGFSAEEYKRLSDLFALPRSRKIATYSKGMQKQAAILLGLSAMPRYLLCDETFDGLDPVMRQLVKRVLADAVAKRGLTAVIASHNLRELEDVCDHVGIMKGGRMLLEKGLDELQDELVKVQLAFADGGALPDGLDILHSSSMGRLQQLVLRGNADEIRERLAAANPLFVDTVPLTLEEIFIYELGGADDEIKDIVL